MFETICTPYGKAAFPTVVKCDGCGKRITDAGWLRHEVDEHYCEDCYADGKADGRADEFRICIHCGKPMIDGMTDGEEFYAHEECFEAAMDAKYGKYCWQLNLDPDGGENGGYYDAYDGDANEWYDTGIYYTEWY